MSYIGEPFTHDLFVSYSHAAVGGASDAPLKVWSDAFVTQLERELRAHPTFGAQLAIFFDDDPRRDQGLDRNAALTAQLRDRVGGAAILQVMMSDHYLRSAWCADERAWWFEKQQSLGLSTDGRVSLARIWPTTLAWPPQFLDERGHQTPGYGFFDPASAETRPQPYEWPAPHHRSEGVFRDQLLAMVAWLKDRIDQLKKRMDERRAALADAARLEEAEGQVLYLHGRAEHAPAWHSARGALVGTGFTVLPSAPEPVLLDPVASQRHRQLRVQAMSECDAVLLVATDDGPAVDADLLAVGRGDRQSAKARSNRFLPCGLINTAGQALALPERVDNAKRLKVDWIDGTRPPWPADVQAWLTERGRAAARSLQA